MENVMPFEYESHQVRVTIDDSGEPWWVAKDVCEVLEIEKYRDAISRLDDDEKGCPVIVDTLGGPQEMSTISESGLYTLIMRSNKPEAKKFRRWVTHDVLPAIRKNGYYAAGVLSRDKTRPMLDMAREYERAVRLFNVARNMFTSTRAPFPTAMIRANDWVRKRTGLDCFREFDLEYLDAPGGLRGILKFVEENCFVGEQYFCHPPELFKRYQEWSEAQELPTYGKFTFYKELAENFRVRRVRRNQDSTLSFEGIRLNDRADVPGEVNP